MELEKRWLFLIGNGPLEKSRKTPETPLLQSIYRSLLNRFKPSSKIFYWPFQSGTSFVDLLCFCAVLCLLCFVCVCLYVLCGHLLGKGWPFGSRLWCLLWVCHFPIGILGQVWYLIVSIPDLCTLTYFYNEQSSGSVVDLGLMSL